MKIYCTKSELYRALNSASIAVGSRTTAKILEGLLFEVEENSLRITGTDTSITIKSTMNIRVENLQDEEKSFVISDQSTFKSIIQKLPSEEVILDYDKIKGSIHIQSGRFQSDYLCANADEFPKITSDGSDHMIIIEKNKMRNLIKKTAFSASKEEINGILTGVLCEIKDGNFRMVAVDAFRMAIFNEEIQDESANFKIVIPAKQLLNLEKVISDDGDENLRMEISERKVVFYVDSDEIIINTLSGNYIDYKRIISAETPLKIRVQKEELIRSIERAALMATGMNNNMIKFDIQEDLIDISSFSDKGKINENIEIIKEGENLKIGFNARYLQEILRNVEDEEIYMYMNNNVSPCIIKPLSGEKYLYLVLPVRIN